MAAVGKAVKDSEAKVSAVATQAGLRALYDAPVGADGRPTGNAPINDWPEA